MVSKTYLAGRSIFILLATVIVAVGTINTGIAGWMFIIILLGKAGIIAPVSWALAPATIKYFHITGWFMIVTFILTFVLVWMGPSRMARRH